MRFFRWMTVLIIALTGSVMAATQQDTFDYKLDNGLQLIVRVDKRAPVVLSSVWYKVGGSYEHNGTTGISHMLEHMMFRGTPSVPGPEFDHIISRNGGKQNAMTSSDFTMYYQMLPKDKLEISFKLEADRMRNLLLKEDIFKQENKVVREERRMRTDDNPSSLTYERFLAAAFVNSPYHHPVVGWMTDLENMTLQDLQQWYEQRYAPNNAVLIVIGDVDPKQVLSLAKQYFAGLKPSTITPPKPRTEVASLGQRRVEVRVPAKTPMLFMGYNVPSLATAQEKSEAYALELLAGLLDAGNSSRLARQLIREQEVAVSASADFSLYSLHSNLFLLTGVPAPAQSLEVLQQHMLEQIKALQTTPVSEAELKRVRAQIIASKIYKRDSLMVQAMDLGAPEMAGLSWKEGDQYFEAIEKITPEQIQQAAKRYLTPDNLTIGVLLPMESQS